MFTATKYLDFWAILKDGELFLLVIPAIRTKKGKYCVGLSDKIGYFDRLEDLEYIFDVKLEK